MARSAGAKRQREALRREAAAYGVAYLALQRVIPLQNEHLYTGVSCLSSWPARFARLFNLPARFARIFLLAGALRAQTLLASRNPSR